MSEATAYWIKSHLLNTIAQCTSLSRQTTVTTTTSEQQYEQETIWKLPYQGEEIDLPQFPLLLPVLHQQRCPLPA